MEDLYIYGTGVLARQIFFYNERDSLYNIRGFLDDSRDNESVFLNKPVYNYCHLKKTANGREKIKIIVAIGYSECNNVRAKICQRVLKDGFSLVNFITKNANYWQENIRGVNIVIFDNVYVGVGCELSDGVIISEGSILSHDIKVGAFSFFSDKVCVGGFVKIGKHSFLGLNSTIISRAHIGNYNIIASGANVIKNSCDNCTLIGNPAVARVKNTLQVSI